MGPEREVLERIRVFRRASVPEIAGPVLPDLPVVYALSQAARPQPRPTLR